MRLRNVVTILLLGVLVASCTLNSRSNVNGRHPVSAERARRLQAALDQALEHGGSPGAQAAVVFSDGRLWQGAAGLADTDAARRVTTDTLFAIGSVTKTYTAATVLDLAAKGELGLDDKLGKWVPRFPAHVDVTIRQLLSHTSGLASLWPSEIEDLLAHDPAARLTDEQVLLAPACDPGACYRYASPDYALLGSIIEVATHRSYAHVVHERLLNQLDAEHTFFPAQERMRGATATGYGGRDGPERADEAAAGTPLPPILERLPAAGGGMVATAADVARFGHELFTGNLVPDRLVAQMVDFEVTAGLPGTLDCVGEGLGVGRTSPLGHEAWGNGGFTGNFRTVLWHFPRYAITIAAIVNDAGPALAEISDAVAKVALDDAPIVHADLGTGFCNIDLATINLDGSGQRWLSTHSATDAAPASVSSDGSRIAFVSDRDGDFDVYVAAPDGSGIRRLVDLPGTERFPRWSPDGDRLLFSSDRGGDEELYVADVEGRNVRQLTHNDVEDSAPAWSPDGARIAFSRGAVDDHDLWLIDADGENERVLAQQQGDEWMPSWSPDGTRLVFSSGYALRVLDLAEGNTTSLDLPIGGRWPTWGPTGRIAYVADGGDLWTIDGEGGDARVVAPTTQEEFAPIWWPDGRGLVYPAGHWQRER